MPKLSLMRSILAAIDRAIRHRAREGGVGKGLVYLHLAVPSRSGPARYVYRRLPVLEAAGLVERARRHSIDVWSLTSAGRRRLKRARRLGGVELPESPQHEAWRSSQLLAGKEIDRCLLGLRHGLTDALRVLDADPPAGSDAFFEWLSSWSAVAGAWLQRPTACMSGLSQTTLPQIFTTTSTRPSAVFRGMSRRGCAPNASDDAALNTGTDMHKAGAMVSPDEICCRWRLVTCINQ